MCETQVPVVKPDMVVNRLNPTNIVLNLICIPFNIILQSARTSKLSTFKIFGH
jgi:hypothetical protein